MEVGGGCGGEERECNNWGSWITVGNYARHVRRCLVGGGGLGVK